MDYKEFNGDQVSFLGFGCMRLPEKDGQIDFDTARQMVDTGIKNGVNYFDTAYMYHGGESERFLKEALVRRYPRESYYLADKLPHWNAGDKAGCEALMDEQLERLGAEYIDFHLIHSISDATFKSCVEKGAFDIQKEWQAQGKIRHRGFSYHGTPDFLETVLSFQSWDFCQLQLNYYDWETQQNAKRQYELCEQYGVPVIAMEPVRGGLLAEVRKDVEEVFLSNDEKSRPVDWALRFAGSLSNVKIVLSGMSSVSQLEHNCGVFSDFKPLDHEEYAVLDEAMTKLTQLTLIGCTSCNYCRVCPEKILIPEIFTCYNEYLTFERNPNPLRWNYMQDIPDDRKADRCTRCGSCVKVCPQSLEIPKLLEKICETVKQIV